jgi:hypothetical protein
MQLKRLVAIAIIAISICACKEDNTIEEDFKKELTELVEEVEIRVHRNKRHYKKRGQLWPNFRAQ